VSDEAWDEVAKYGAKCRSRYSRWLFLLGFVYLVASFVTGDFHVSKNGFPWQAALGALPIVILFYLPFYQAVARKNKLEQREAEQEAGGSRGNGKD